MIDKDLIPQPHLWTLRILISLHQLEAAFIPPVDTDEIIYRAVTLDPMAPSPLKAVEDAIYDNPVLLNQYRAVEVAFDTDSFIVMPGAFGDDEEPMAAKALKLMGVDVASSATKLLKAPASAPSTDFFFVMDEAMNGFLRRTFYNVAIGHPLSFLASRLPAAPGEPRLTVAMRQGRLDLIATDADSSLLLLNQFSYEAISDAAYFIYAAARELEASHPTIIRHISASGPQADRDSLLSILDHIPGLAATPLAPASWRGSQAASAPLCLTLQPIVI
ncbi:MAG: DUF3822 family protein [Pseudoflavonifractor sp.]|nr:DUF3822 family protein [Alloprevotella sp.]MCM1117134.1 DUF3822 family protein [Pseudoflavonifractor sp.]